MSRLHPALPAQRAPRRRNGRAASRMHCSLFVAALPGSRRHRAGAIAVGRTRLCAAARFWHVALGRNRRWRPRACRTRRADCDALESQLPHGLLVALFGTVALFDCIVFAVGLHRFWYALTAAYCHAPTETQAAPETSPIGVVLRRLFWHHDFARCTQEAPRRASHTIVVYSMLALGVVDLWVLTARFNPLRSGLVYPLGITDPWKLLANLAGVALIAGCVLMTRDACAAGSPLQRQVPAQPAPIQTGCCSASCWLWHSPVCHRGAALHARG